jgi:hypothetical protein
LILQLNNSAGFIMLDKDSSEDFVTFISTHIAVVFLLIELLLVLFLFRNHIRRFIRIFTTSLCYTLFSWADGVDRNLIITFAFGWSRHLCLSDFLPSLNRSRLITRFTCPESSFCRTLDNSDFGYFYLRMYVCLREIFLQIGCVCNCYKINS